MKASELITELQEAINEHGDLNTNVVTDIKDGRNRYLHGAELTIVKCFDGELVLRGTNHEKR